MVAIIDHVAIYLVVAIPGCLAVTFADYSMATPDDPFNTAWYTRGLPSGECLLVVIGGDLGIPRRAVSQFLFLLTAWEAFDLR